MSGEPPNYRNYRAYFDGFSHGAGGRPICPDAHPGSADAYTEGWSDGYEARHEAAKAYAFKVGVLVRVIKPTSPTPKARSG